MKALRFMFYVLLLVVLLGLSSNPSGLARAQSGGGPTAEFTLSAAEGRNAGYDLTWNTMDSGGATFASGGGYELGGTLGQPDAGALGGGYALTGGFWSGVRIPALPGYPIFLPLILRNS